MTKRAKDPGERAFNAKVGANIRARRTASGLTQAELAERVQVSRVSVNMWESGTNAVSPFNLARLAIVLETSVDELVTGAAIRVLPPIVRVRVATRRPEDYVLVDTRDASRWVIVDGAWVREEEAARD